MPTRRETRSLLFALLLGGLLLVLVTCAAFTITPTFAGLLVITPTTSHSVSWSFAEIAKPTYTPSPPPTFTPTSPDSAAVTPTSADESTLLTMNIVDGSTLPASDATGSDQADSANKYILVSISEQHLYAYAYGQLVYSFVASTGMGNSTRVGTFSVLDKIPNAYGANWNIWMPDWLGIYWSGGLENGIHALPILPGGDRLWSGYLGTPISFGCVVLGVDEALQLYNWVDVGTPVEIRW